MAQELTIVLDGGHMTAICENVRMSFSVVKLREVPKLAKRLEDSVRRQVDASGVRDSHGKIKRWQVLRVGTKCGYAAVSALRTPSGPNGAGAVTNYLNSGHEVRFPSGKSARYTPHVNYARSRAYGFYQSATAEISSLTDEFAQQLETEIANAIDRQQMEDHVYELDRSGVRGA